MRLRLQSVLKRAHYLSARASQYGLTAEWITAMRVCVIGAGPAGLCAAKRCKEQGFDVEVYEKTAHIGGTWNYSPKTGIHSSMYEVMQTNLPKEVMAFPGIPFPDNLKSFVDHQDVLKYVEDYGDDVNVHLNTEVVEVTEQEKGTGKWKITVKNLTTNERSTKIFDAFFVCNGHYATPNQPFNAKKFRGSVIHSHDYRHNRSYSGDTVAVIGAGPSGIDIALQVAEAAEKVLLVGRARMQFPNMPDNFQQQCHNVKSIEEDGIVLENESLVECDHIIICTGYLYTFPFLPDSLVETPEGARLVLPLYEHVVHSAHPHSVFFIGLNFTVVPFILFETQVAFAISILAGKIEAPSLEDSQQWHENRLRELKEQGLPLRMYHLLADHQWDYFDRLAKKGHFPAFYTPLVRQMYDFVSEQRKHNLAGYKDINFQVQDDDTFTATL